MTPCVGAWVSSGDLSFYPAQTWPHKNHLRLLRALAVVRDRMGLRIPLVCSGHLTAHHGDLVREARRLGLEGQVVFLGFVSPHELQALYRVATAMVFPSLFEGWGQPVVEAFRTGLPVAASSASCLPEVADGGALLFDPLDEAGMADAILRVWLDDDLRERLRERGRTVSSQLSWVQVARTYRAHYRRLARRPADDSDSALILETLGQKPNRHANQVASSPTGGGRRAPAGERYRRPNEMDGLRGKASKVDQALGRRPRVRFADLVRNMLGADLAEAGTSSEATVAGG